MFCLSFALVRRRLNKKFKYRIYFIVCGLAVLICLYTVMFLINIKVIWSFRTQSFRHFPGLSRYVPSQSIPGFAKNQ